MKTYLLAGVAAIAMTVGGSVAVRAADLPAPEVPMIAAAPIAAAYDWTGFYIGANVGYGWGKLDRNGGGAGRLNGDIDGIVGGAQVGGNWQWDKFVAGLETDIQGTGFDSERRGNRSFDPKGGIFGTVRGRVGFAFDRFLVYGTGGFAYSDVNIKRNNDDWKWGWTAGGGVEAAVTDNISVKVEYLYADLGDDNFRNRRTGDRFKYDYTQNLVRVGVNYKF
jgi:outer membrane immunogenic protein